MHRLAARVMAAMAMVLLVVALVQPWMSVPARILELRETVSCEVETPRATVPFRVACLVFALVLGFRGVHRRGPRDWLAMLAAVFHAALLFFPFTVMALEPRLSAEANWLQIQHENLVWLGGDLHTNLEAGRNAWKEGVYLVDTPRQISVIRVPSSRLGAFQLSRLMNWFETLGYSNRFCQFVNRGWFAALLGSTLLMMAQCLPEGRLNRGRAARSLTAFGAAFVLGLALAASPLLLSAAALDRCRDAIARGHHDDADRHLADAARYLPALREDTYYVAQRGLLDLRRGLMNTPESRIYQANLLERAGRYAQAMEIYQDLIQTTPEASATRREAIRAVLRAAIHALNGQRPGEAIRLLEQVLREEPCNLKANYSLQLAYLRARRRDDLDRLVRRLVAVYDHFQMPTKEIVLASSYENVMLAAFRDHDVSRAAAYSAKVRNP